MRYFAIVAAALAALVMAVPASGFESWGHWAGSGERHITVVDLTPTASWNVPLRDAAAEWSKSPYVELTVVEGTPPTPGTCPWTYGVINVCAEPHPDSWSGWASQQNEGTHFVAARAWFNTRLSFVSETYANYAVRRYLACHELGHDLGLSYHPVTKRKSPSNSCLGGAVASYLYPSAQDFANLATLYAHTP